MYIYRYTYSTILSPFDPCTCFPIFLNHWNLSQTTGPWHNSHVDRPVTGAVCWNRPADARSGDPAAGSRRGIHCAR